MKTHSKAAEPNRMATFITRRLGIEYRGLLALPGRVFRAFLVWQDRATERARLEALTERDRADIGLRYEDVMKEARKPFWMA